MTTSTSRTSDDLHVVLGSGPAGSTVAAELAARGHRVTLVDRNGKGASPAGVVRAVADATDVEQLTAATVGATAIYHCVNVAYHLQLDVMPHVTTAVLAAAAANNARLVVLDTLYPYGEADGEHITEDTPWSATTTKGLLRAELDRRYLDAHRAGSAQVVAGRAADFYGPGVLNSALGGGVFPGALTGGEVYTFGDTTLPHSYSYIEDVAAALATLGEQPAGDGRIWHLPTAPARSTADVLKVIAELTGKPVLEHNLQHAEPAGPFDKTFMDGYEEMFYQYRIAQNLVSTPFQEQFGMQPTALDQGLAATVDWYREMLAHS